MLYKQAKSKCLNQPPKIVINISFFLGVYLAKGRQISHSSTTMSKQQIEVCKKTLRLVKDLDDRTGEGDACFNLGNAYHSLGDFKQAIEYHNQSLTIAKELGQRDREGCAYCNLGNAYQEYW